MANNLKVLKGQNREFRTKTNYCSHLLVGFKINAHATRSLRPSKAQGRQGKRLYGWHKPCSYVRLAKRKVRGDLPEKWVSG